MFQTMKTKTVQKKFTDTNYVLLSFGKEDLRIGWTVGLYACLSVCPYVKECQNIKISYFDQFGSYYT